MEYDNFAHPSLSAAILLGLRQVIGGSPEHLDVATISDALRAPNRRALLIHDTVPGGTGYLAEFADPPRCARCSPRPGEPCVANALCRIGAARLPPCLLPFAAPHDLDKVSRLTAARRCSTTSSMSDADADPDLGLVD